MASLPGFPFYHEKQLYSDEHSGSHPDLTHVHTSARLKGHLRP
jgi:hypothetical protein